MSLDVILKRMYRWDELPGVEAEAYCICEDKNKVYDSKKWEESGDDFTGVPVVRKFIEEGMYAAYVRYQKLAKRYDTEPERWGWCILLEPDNDLEHWMCGRSNFNKESFGNYISGHWLAITKEQVLDVYNYCVSDPELSDKCYSCLCDLDRYDLSGNFRFICECLIKLFHRKYKAKKVYKKEFLRHFKQGRHVLLFSY